MKWPRRIDFVLPDVVNDVAQGPEGIRLDNLGNGAQASAPEGGIQIASLIVTKNIWHHLSDADVGDSFALLQVGDE